MKIIEIKNGIIQREYWLETTKSSINCSLAGKFYAMTGKSVESQRS